MRTRPSRPPLARLGAVAALLTLSLAACGDDGEGKESASDPASPSSSTTSSGSTPGSTTTAAPTSTATARSYPLFAPTDYTYRLEVLCYCPQVGSVRVTVTDGKVTAARSVTGPAKGKRAPQFARLTINDIIERANDPKIAEADVTWPAGQDHPSTVALDQIENAVDDEVTYTIRSVRVR